MGLFTRTEFNNLEELFVEQLCDLYDAETRLTDVLPKMAEAAESAELKAAFKHHLDETKQQIQRLETIFGKLDQQPRREACQAMKGLIKEGEQMINATGDPSVKDAALIAAAQRVEHYEMAAYGTARTFAHQLGRQDLANLLQQSLDEEFTADKKLTDIAESAVNIRASQA